MSDVKKLFLMLDAANTELARRRDKINEQAERIKELEYALDQWDRLPMYDDMDAPTSWKPHDNYRVDRVELEYVQRLSDRALYPTESREDT